MRKIFVIFFLSISSLSFAHKYYVSTSGNNTNDGLTPSTAWQTTQYAESHAISAGDTIALKKGDTWSTDLALGIHHGGTAGNPITWDGASWGTGANAIIKSNCNRTGSNLSIVNIIGCSYVTFRNIVLDGGNLFTFGLVIGGTDNFYSPGGVQNSEKGIIIQNCSVLNCGNGINYSIGFLCQTWHNDISDITVKGNTFDGSDDEQLSFYGGKSPDGGTPAECRNVYIGYNNLTNWGRRGQSTGYGLQLNNKITNVIIENNILTSGSSGHGNAIQIESNEPLTGWYPTGVVVRYNKISTTLDNTFCIYITQGQAKTVDVYSNLLYSTTKTTNGGGIWVSASLTPAWSGARLNFYNNTVYSLSGRSFTNDCDVAGVVTLKNNLFYNAGADDYGMMCLVNNTPGVTIHSNNLYFRSVSPNFTKVKDGSSYAQTSSQVLSWEVAAVVTDPLFVATGTDFHLLPGSPAIGAGIPIPGITKDINGVLYSNPPDIGCFQSSGSIVVPPVLKSSTIANTSPSVVDLAYDLNLDNSSVPPVSAFDLKVNSLSLPVSSVAVSGNTVHLTLATAVSAGAISIVSYMKPAVNALQTTSGGQAANINNQLVTNNILTSTGSTTAGSATSNIQMTIYPNPAHQILNMSLKYSSAFSVQAAIVSSQILRIFDISGKLITERLLTPGIDLVAFPINFRSGVYIVQILLGSSVATSQKLLVNN